MTRVRGSNICLLRQFIGERFGDEQWAGILRRLSAEDRSVVESALPVGWYELSVQHRVFDAFDYSLSRADFDPIATFARYTADHDLTKVHRLFLKMRNPVVVLEKSGEYWRRFYDDGHWKVSRFSDIAAAGELLDIGEPAPVFCRFLEAYIATMFQLAGAHDAVCRHTRCVHRGAASCYFEGRWSGT